MEGGTPGTGNIDADPAFYRTPGPGPDTVWGTTDDDYGNVHLQASSPCIDSGNNPSVPTGVTRDLDNNSRIVDFPLVRDPGSIVDIGVFERALPLTVSSDSLAFDTSRAVLALQFSGAIDTSTLSSGDLQLINETTQQPMAVPDIAQLTFDPTTFIARWAFWSLPDGNYEATIAANTVDDSAEDGLSADYTTQFFILTGDGNHDRQVDILDFNLLAKNFGKTGQTLSQGNYDYSPGGTVDILDFNILATHFGNHLDAPISAQSISSSQTRAIGEPTLTSTDPDWPSDALEQKKLLLGIGTN